MVFFHTYTQNSVEPDQEKIRIFLVWGQSHVSGGGVLDGLAIQDPQWFHHPGHAVPGCYHYDKTKRFGGQPVDLSTTDSTRGGEAHAWQEMTAGYAGADPIEPWISDPVSPLGGWDMLFAHRWRQHTGERIFIVKMGPGGSKLFPGVPDWNVATVGGGTDSFLEVLMDGYWAPALEAAITMAGGDRNKVTLGGVISIIGSSDSVSAAAIAAFPANMTNVIAHMRGILAQPGEDTDIPWLLVKSPLPESTPGNPDLREDVAAIRAHQQTVADTLTNVTLADAGGMHFGPDNIHFSWEGNAQLATELFNKTLAMTGYVGPVGD